MEETVRQLVRTRAGQRCEYCCLHQNTGSLLRFHIEHIRPRRHAGDDHPDNLVLACPNCNWNKGPNLSAIDPVSDAIVPLFNPRRNVWREHFEVVALRILGLTSTGRATAALLRLNSAERLEIRQEFESLGELAFRIKGS